VSPEHYQQRILDYYLRMFALERLASAATDRPRSQNA